jgi:hypothetical protein
MKDKSRLDPVFLPILQRMIDDLTDPHLLRRCLRGLTQNSNESINAVVRFRSSIPSLVFSNRFGVLSQNQNIMGSHQFVVR